MKSIDKQKIVGIGGVLIAAAATVLPAFGIAFTPALQSDVSDIVTGVAALVGIIMAWFGKSPSEK